MKVCVIGASGSIGSCLIKGLLAHDCEVTAVVRSLTSASRIGRYPIKFVQQDIVTVNPTDLQQAMQGCDVVIDCSFSKLTNYQQRIEESTLIATKIANAVLHSQVKQLIHYGTISVYPVNESATSFSIDESVSCEPRNDGYADSKLAAENVLLQFAQQHALPVVVLQLPVVYGPFMLWSQAPVATMSQSQWVMPNDLRGVCTPLHVDDVVNATWLAMQTSAANGQRVLLSGDERLSWHAYYQAYADLDPSLSLGVVEREQVMMALRKQRQQQRPWNQLTSAFANDADFRQLLLSQFGFRHIYRLVKRYRGEQGIQTIKNKLIEPSAKSSQEKRYIDLNTLTTLDTMPNIKSNKAQTLLGFNAAISFEQGMQDTYQWLKWARLL